MSVIRLSLSLMQLALLILLLVGAATSCWSANVELVADGFQDPVAVVQPPGIADKLFVIEQSTGKIRIITLPGQTILADPFLTVPVFTWGSGSETGLLGMAFHPQYATNGLFFVNRTVQTAGQIRTEICRFQAIAVNGSYGSATAADLASSVVTLGFDQPEDDHNGGWMAFDPEGNLCIASGDGGGGDDMHGTIGNAQDRTNLLGKILRIRPDLGPIGSSPTYTIPPSNPYSGHATFRQEIWHYGLRNPWRCSFDRSTGDLWIGDVGQFSREEIDFAPSGQGGLKFRLATAGRDDPESSLSQ